MENVKITLVKSLIGSLPNQKATAASLGLNKLGKSITLPMNDALAGKIKILAHLVKVETLAN